MDATHLWNRQKCKRSKGSETLELLLESLNELCYLLSFNQEIMFLYCHLTKQIYFKKKKKKTTHLASVNVNFLYTYSLILTAWEGT